MINRCKCNTLYETEDKKKYRDLCQTDSTIPIFSKSWWLDAMCAENHWDVIIIEKGGEIVAAFPYYYKVKYRLKCITMPNFTPRMGIWLKYGDKTKVIKQMTFEKEIIDKILAQIPSYDYFNIFFPYTFTNWLPFYWNGFKQMTYYSYVIDDLTDLDKVFNSFEHSKRKNIKKSENIVEVKFDLNAKDFYENHMMTLHKQGRKISYSFELFKRMYDDCYNNNAGRTIYAVDNVGNIHSALFVVWDNNSAYDLISTIDPDFRNSGSATLLIKKFIEYLSDKTEKFDFEGSMIEGVENSFRQFGTTQHQYFNIKGYSRLMRVLISVTDIFKAVLGKPIS